MVRGVTITMVAGEPTLVFWRIEDVGKGLDVSRDMGLPLTSPGGSRTSSSSASGCSSWRTRGPRWSNRAGSH